MDDDPDECWKYLLVYTDDILCISHDAREVIVKLEQILKGGVGPPAVSDLGATIGKHKVPGTGGQELWYMSYTQYLSKGVNWEH
jgi:hypothetical protein